MKIVRSITVEPHYWNAAQKQYPGQMSQIINNFLKELVGAGASQDPDLGLQREREKEDALGKEIAEKSAELETTKKRIKTILSAQQKKIADFEEREKARKKSEKRCMKCFQSLQPKKGQLRVKEGMVCTNCLSVADSAQKKQWLKESRYLAERRKKG